MPEPVVQNTLQKRPELRRRWFYLLPAVFVTYSLAYLDRTNYGFGAAAGMAQTLHISASQSAFLGSLFFLGYFLFQIPGASYARQKSAARLIFWALIGWGLLAALTGIVRTFWMLALVRFLLGVAESVILPAALILLSNWFTRAERSRVSAILLLGNPVTVLWMSAATGYLIKAMGWQMTFVIEGLPSVLWAFIWIAVAKDKPQQAAWMSEDCCKELAAQLEQEQTALPPTVNFAATLRMPGVLLLSVHYFFWSVGVYGFVLWLPTIIRAGMAQGIEIVGLLNALPYLLAILLMTTVGYFSDRVQTRKHFIWPALMLAGVALFSSYLTASHSFWTAYLFLILAGGAMYASYGPFFAIIPEMLPKNVAGEVMALVNSCGALGGFAGTWLVGLLQSITGNSRAGFLFMSLSLLLAGALLLLVPMPRGQRTLSAGPMMH